MKVLHDGSRAAWRSIVSAGIYFLIVVLFCVGIQSAYAANPDAAFPGRLENAPSSPEMVEGDGEIRLTTEYSETVETFLLSNEAPGHLIDSLILQGLGDQTLYEALGYLKLQSGTIISDAFYDKVYNAPAGSEVFTAKLNNYGGLNGAIEISADGTVHTRDVQGGSYDSAPGYATALSQNGQFKFTYAEDVAHYIYTGQTQVQVGPIVYTYNYYAFAIAWRDGCNIFLPLLMR